MTLSEDARARLAQQCGHMVETKGDNFGNARDIRNLFERAVRSVAARVSAGDANIEEIKAQDI
jgi:hypothetical protein